jgi:hypothetical protein
VERFSAPPTAGAPEAESGGLDIGPVDFNGLLIETAAPDRATG